VLFWVVTSACDEVEGVEMMVVNDELFDKWGGLREPQTVACPTVPWLLHSKSVPAPATDLIVAEDGRMTYEEAEKASLLLARQLLASGYGKGTHIGILYPNGARWVVRWLACMRIGAIAVPMNVFLKPPELRSLIAHADLEVLLIANDSGDEDYLGRVLSAIPELGGCAGRTLVIPALPCLRAIWVNVGHGEGWATVEGDQAFGPFSEEMVFSMENQVTPADVAVIIYTSGTTAEPKGVILTHGALVRHAANVGLLQKIEDSDRFYSISPFFWIGGLLVTLLSCMSRGATVLTQNRFSPEACLEFLEAEHATVVRLYPNARRALEEHPRFSEHDLSQVKVGLDWPIPTPNRMMRTHGALGMTETCGPHIYSSKWPEPFPDIYPGSHGPPVPGMHHRIVDENGLEVPHGEVGEILVRGYALMVGVYKKEREQVFEQDGWYRTGDLGLIDDGVVYFRGRLKSVIKTAGANVSPQEVELALQSCRGVREAYVVGIPAGDRGEDVAAAVISDGAPFDAEAIRLELAKKLATFKIPRFITAIEEGQLPRSSAGEKVNLNELRVLVAARLADGADISQRRES
jgi:acyl-CoA synthetase (AMP-forming)/AMP-acid ligase II